MIPLILAWLVCGAPSHHSAAKAPVQRAPAPQEEVEETPIHLPPPPALPTKYRAVVVLPIQSFEVPDALLATIETVVVDEIDETANTRAISSADAMTDLSALGLKPRDCERDAACLAKAGLYARAHAVLDLYVSSLGGAFNVSMRLLDTTTGAELGRAAEVMPDEEQLRVLLLHRMVLQLLMPETYVGDVTVQVKQDGAEIYIDDTLVGLSPMTHPVSYKAGVHILRVSKEGYTDVNRFVEIVNNRATTLYVDMAATTVTVGVDMIASKDSGALFVVADEPGFEIRIDGEPAGVTPLQGALFHLPPGQRTLSLRKPGRPVVTQIVTIASGRRSDFALTTEPDGILKVQLLKLSDPHAALPTEAEARSIMHSPAPQDPSPAITEKSWRTPTGIAVGSVGVVAVVVGAIFGNNARQFNNEAAAIIARINSPAVTTVDQRIKLQNRLAALNSKGPTATKLEEGFLIGGGVVLAAGAGFLVWDWWRQTPDAQTSAETPAGHAIRLTPWPMHGGGCGLSLVGGF